MLEQEGLNTWGIWNFSDWDALAAHLKKGYEYGKQRCTAYPRFVIQRDLVDSFLAMYLPMVSSLKVGHPLAVAADGDPLPELDFGPVISAAKAAELKGKVDEALRWGATPLYRGKLDPARFIDGQDTCAYVAPVAMLAPPGASRLMHEEPFGPVDTIVVVDTAAELLAQMNASNGALVASIACDDQTLAGELAEHLQAFKIGINKPRSRGDRDEPFGGRGASWKGAFVGGAYLVQAVTEGPPVEQLYGNFPDYNRYPGRDLSGSAGIDSRAAASAQSSHRQCAAHGTVLGPARPRGVCERPMGRTCRRGVLFWLVSMPRPGVGRDVWRPGGPAPGRADHARRPVAAPESERIVCSRSARASSAAGVRSSPASSSPGSAR